MDNKSHLPIRADGWSKKMACDQIDTPQRADSVDYKKVLEEIQDKEAKEKIAEMVKNHSRRAYLKRLQKCGVVFK